MREGEGLVADSLCYGLAEKNLISAVEGEDDEVLLLVM